MGDGIIDATHPVARMPSIIRRILRRYALCRGSDRPTPCGGSGVAPALDDIVWSGVVVKELMEERDEALLLGGVEGIGYLGSNQVRFIVADRQG